MDLYGKLNSRFDLTLTLAVNLLIHATLSRLHTEYLLTNPKSTLYSISAHCIREKWDRIQN